MLFTLVLPKSKFVTLVMKIISYNVNGIRAAMRKGLMEWLTAADPDVFCMCRKPKAMEEQVESRRD